ncbi:MAG: TIGR00289 family protein [Candidatus Methanomethylicota archaeon]|nr:MAG: TIGR00289 family protein [Candidatus Verstraetearchaeota archaeon]
MKLALLSSGGKDSLLAAYRVVKEGHKLVCFVSILPERSNSWMFHVPNVSLTKLHAEAMGLPHILEVSSGVKERELADLVRALEKARDIYGAEGVVSGAIASRYQKERVDNICSNLGLISCAPLWGQDQLALLNEVIESGFEVIFVGVYAMGMDSSWLGRKLTYEMIKKLVQLNKLYGISLSGEGGEYETLVLDMPLFKKRMRILRSEVKWFKSWGILEVKEAILEEKCVLH